MVKYKNFPFPILIVDNFIKESQCEKLISDASRIFDNNSSLIHGGRKMLPCTANEFNLLIKESKEWSDLHRKINSINLINILLEKISLEDCSSRYTNWFKKRKITISQQITSIFNFFDYKFFFRYRRVLNKKIKEIPNKMLLLIFILKIIDDCFRVLVSIKNHISRKCKLVLFYDYSVSNEGYSRKIHRDSDSRVIVILIYLNKLEENVDGGNLEIYDSVFKSKYPPFLDQNQSIKTDEIKPSPGKLVMFLNTSNAYHAVSRMSHSDFGRHFIYGGFTMESSIGSLALIESKGKSPTEYHTYK